MSSLLKAASLTRPRSPSTTEIGNLFSLTVVVIEAKSIRAADENGFSDPFVELKIEPDSKTAKDTKKTQTIKKTLNPRWDETFTFSINSLDFDSFLEVTVKDWDRFSKNDKLGYLKIPLNKLKKNVVDNRWFSLEDPSNKYRPSGNINLSIHATDFGRSSFGVVYRNVMPTINVQTLDEEAVLILKDSTKQSLDELELAHSTVSETHRVKQLRQKLANDIRNILSSYPAAVYPKLNVDVTLLPTSDETQVEDIRSKVEVLEFNNTSIEEQARIHELETRINLLHSIIKALDEVLEVRNTLRQKVLKVESLLGQNDS
ncbi:protein kinase C beta type [Acrasis kona]